MNFDQVGFPCCYTRGSTHRIEYSRSAPDQRLSLRRSNDFPRPANRCHLHENRNVRSMVYRPSGTCPDESASILGRLSPVGQSPQSTATASDIHRPWSPSAKSCTASDPSVTRRTFTTSIQPGQVASHWKYVTPTLVLGQRPSSHMHLARQMTSPSTPCQ